MFVAKFNSTSGAPFAPDKNGNYPFIGSVICGKYHGSIINGSIFEREELAIQQLYLCQNTLATDSDGLVITDSGDNQIYNTEVISKVTIPELIGVQKELGPPFRIIGKPLKSIKVADTESVTTEIVEFGEE